MKIALSFSLIVVMTVLAVVAGVTGNKPALALALMTVALASTIFMWLFVETLRGMRR
ncbi:hypothetical protein [Pseudomonas lurida]|uniref:hypothetical protein n=1 Tax=Pseudomonas lurida TaxID=244566 RepID=UPI001428A4F1|nr:hypothetical protein [Pseudomonas lurida]